LGLLSSSFSLRERLWFYHVGFSILYRLDDDIVGGEEVEEEGGRGQRAARTGTAITELAKDGEGR